ncbi:MAG: endolytic transglycosylase MltG [Azoarcus sp.]|jgi:UPF0755 protein|nr:endolytic transglycosylase MltG [Azoarcus sp.]
MKKFFLSLFVLLLLLAGGVAWLGKWYSVQPLKVAGGATEFTVPRGAGMRQTAETMARAGVRAHPILLTMLARATGHTFMKAGTYEVKSGITPLQLLLKVESGDVKKSAVLFVEGWTFKQAREALEKHPDLLADTVGLSDDELLARIGADAKHPEGLFFPDTYTFDKNTSALAVLTRAYRAMQTRLESEWAKRDANLPLKKPYDALILASIVEKETAHPDDRLRIANVFINRLRVGMLLQTDPTVIYGMGDKYTGKLRYADLDADTPWNTYVHAGLPPTPIALPGLKSLQAVLHPEGGDMLYFVARGDGRSEFSRTLNEHNKAVAKYQRGGRAVPNRRAAAAKDAKAVKRGKDKK